MKTYGLALIVVLTMVFSANPVFAQVENPPGGKVIVSPPATSTATTVSLGGAAIGAGLVIIGAAFGFGRIGAAALEGMARQPEVAGKIQPAMIIIAALLEGATFFALLICLMSR